MRKVQKRVSWLLTVVMLFTLLMPVGTAWAEGSSAKTVTILATSDMHGRIYPYEYATGSEAKNAGLAKIFTLVKQERAKNPNTILVDNGDALQDNMANLFNDNPVHPMIEAMNYMGYDTFTLGNHEFNYGLNFLNKNIAAFKGKVLSANIYKEDGSRFVNPYTIVVKDGVRVAIVGITPPHIPTWEASTPDNFKGLTFTDPVAETKKVVKELEGKYDVLIGVMHLGDTPEYGTTDGAMPIAEACPQFNAIICGHAHSKFDNKTSNSGVKLIEPGKYGQDLAKVDVKVEKTANGYTVKEVAEANLDTDNVAADPDMLAKFEYVHNTCTAEGNKVIGEITEDFIPRVDYLTGLPKVTTLPTSQVQDNAVIDLINDVQAFYAGADISSAALFKNESNLKQGPFLMKDVAFIYMYDNTLVGVNITGKNLKAYMEWSANYYNTYRKGDLAPGFNPDVRGYNYDMFSGVNYDIDLSKPSGSRITNATFKGDPIQDDKIYKLAINNYRFGTLMSLKLATAADKYFDSNIKYPQGSLVRDLIVKYVQEEKNGRIAPKVDNNWKLTGVDYNNPLRDKVIGMVISGEVKIPTSMDGRTPNVKALNVYDVYKLGKLSGTTAISLLSVNDFHGTLAGDTKNPGISKLAAYLKNEKKANPAGTFILSAGDMFQGSADSNLLYGKPVVTAMNNIGFDAMTIGNHEFDWGIDKLKEREAASNFPYLAANIVNKKDGKTADFVKPYTIIEKNGIKVGIIGIATPETLTKTKPDNIAPYLFRDPAETVNVLAPELRAKGADLVVVLSHLGASQDSKTKEITGEAADLAKKVTGVDAIITGHTHTTVAGTVNNIPVVQAYYNGRSVAHVDLYLDSTTKKVTYSEISVDPTVVKAIEDPSVKAWFDLVQKVIAPVKNEIIGKAEINVPHNKGEVQVTLLGEWVADQMRKAANADIAIQNGGGIRADIPAGDITMGTMYTLMPFDNTLFTMEMTGKQVKEAIEHGILTSKGNGEYAEGFAPGQFSGVKVKFDSSKAYGQRIVEITLADGTPIDDSKIYKVVTNDFCASGGDGYTVFKSGTNGKDTGIPVRDALVNAIKAAKTLKPVDDQRLIDVNAGTKTSMAWFNIAA